MKVFQFINRLLFKRSRSAKELDGVALASFISPFDDIVIKRSTWKVSDYLKEQELRWKPYLIEKMLMNQKSC